MLKQLFSLCLLLLPVSALASGVATFQGLDNGKAYKLSIEYLDQNTSRIEMQDKSDVATYLIFKNKQAEVVTAYQGNTLVMDLDNMSQMAQGLGVMSVLGIDSETLLIRVIDLKPTGKKEKVGGIDGDVYKLTWSRNKVKYQDELVVSKDKRVREYTKAWASAVEVISKSSPSINIQGDNLLSWLNKDKLGILRLGTRLRLVSVQSKLVSESRFIAPDTSFTLQGLGDLFGGL